MLVSLSTCLGALIYVTQCPCLHISESWSLCHGLSVSTFLNLGLSVDVSQNLDLYDHVSQYMRLYLHISDSWSLCHHVCESWSVCLHIGISVSTSLTLGLSFVAIHVPVFIHVSVFCIVSAAIAMHLRRKRLVTFTSRRACLCYSARSHSACQSLSIWHSLHVRLCLSLCGPSAVYQTLYVLYVSL